MATINRAEMKIVDDAFGLGRDNPKGSGYLLDFSDRSLPEWFDDELGVDINDPRYQFRGTSKANRLRGFIDIEPAPLVARMMRKLWNYREASGWQPDQSLTAEQFSALKCQVVTLIARLEDPTVRLTETKAMAVHFDAAHIADQIKRIEGSIESDPALAIGTAKELVESCFKTILSERGIGFDKEDLPQLGKKVFASLKLLPDDIPDAAKGAKTIKVMLSNLATVVQGVAEIRGLYGTGHGKHGKVRGVGPRHARLAVNAATTVVNFAFETHMDSLPSPIISGAAASA